MRVTWGESHHCLPLSITVHHCPALSSTVWHSPALSGTVPSLLPLAASPFLLNSCPFPGPNLTDPQHLLFVASCLVQALLFKQQVLVEWTATLMVKNLPIWSQRSEVSLARFSRLACWPLVGRSDALSIHDDLSSSCVF